MVTPCRLFYRRRAYCIFGLLGYSDLSLVLGARRLNVSFTWPAILRLSLLTSPRSTYRLYLPTDAVSPVLDSLPESSNRHSMDALSSRCVYFSSYICIMPDVLPMISNPDAEE